MICNFIELYGYQGLYEFNFVYRRKAVSIAFNSWFFQSFGCDMQPVRIFIVKRDLVTIG